MKKRIKNVWKICFIISCLIISALTLKILMLKKENKNSNSSKQNPQITYGNGNYTDIMLEEDLYTSGEIKNLENVTWDNVRISQNGGNAEVYLTINYDEPEQTIENKQLKIELLDSKGNVLAEGNATIEELSKVKTYTDINFTVSMPEPVIVYALRISCQ